MIAISVRRRLHPIKRHAVRTVLLALLPWIWTAARADDGSDFCSTPTGVGTHACTFPEGQIVVETALVDWTHDRSGGLHTDSVLAGDTTVHLGISHNIEIQLGWTPFDYERTINRHTGLTNSTRGIGDVTIGGKLALLSADDHPIGIAIQPTLVIPVGGLKLGSSGVGGGIVLPISYDLNDAVAIELTPEGEYTGDRDDNGLHWEYGTTLGVDLTMNRHFSTTLEYSLVRDRDPAYSRVRQLATVSFGWKPSTHQEFNLGLSGGLDRQSPRVELIAGLTRHFH